MWNMDSLCDNKRIKYKNDRIKIKYDNSNKIVRLTAIRWVNEVGIKLKLETQKPSGIDKY